jgi:hypothetical protein
MRVAHLNSSPLKSSSSSFAATAFFGFLNTPSMRRAFAENAENVDRAQLPDWAKAIIQNPQPTRIHRIHKGPRQGSRRTPSDLAFILLATVAGGGLIIASLALGGAPGVDPDQALAIFAAP